jgi:hypothetical protein
MLIIPTPRKLILSDIRIFFANYNIKIDPNILNLP